MTALPVSDITDITSLEHPTLKVPYELLNKKFRFAQKNLEREVSHTQASTSDLEKSLLNSTVDVKDITNLLGGVVERLQALKRKAEESVTEELEAARVCKRRVEHLIGHSTSNQSQLALWRRQRLDRMLVEYFLRCGCYQTALKLAKQSGIEDLVNLDIFMLSREVEDSLVRHETTKCLTWCYDNKSKLRKLKSTLEFNLRVQEYVELVRTDHRVDAVKHARKYFSSFEDQQIGDVQRCMALLAFPADTELSPYRDLLDEGRWDRLVTQFRQESYRVFQLANQSLFTVALQTGLSALKTPRCYKQTDSRNPECPVCQEPLSSLALPLPFAHCSHSHLVCAITGKSLNEHNQPMMLPNGYVYGEQSLKDMAAQNGGQVVCPRTKEVFQLKAAEKVYVM